ncbi:hypothetical protein CNMCM5793_005024 [Aspergillus hiratsukae]|uniref:Cyclin-D1-binding protein 1-like N-terminal domain-containing protein n=1 Tax=Aspergillus hiratsukae TaxID=1194566 RepID=A0A8H6P419_9EURO|nr:hypothetical protein CNMCM5793_005024 [Aspergillus hiratsukae]KAF7156773.1 hypothetical protein CNMCM6106_001215 [Aspergillus hiratsukae]
MAKQLRVSLTTTLTLLEQLQGALSAPAGDTPAELSGKDALPLLSASATALRSQVTKLSLLAITSPFTHSAVGTVLSALNGSVLPSLVTAALLVTPTNHTKAFHAEVHALTKTTLRELTSLVTEVQAVAEKTDKAKEGQKKRGELSQEEKDAVTVATGRVWDTCDTLIDVAAKGVVGFVIRRVEEWRDLVRDAVEEIEAWDPEEDGDDFFDDLLSDDGEKDTQDEEEEDTEESSAALHAAKKSTLRILKPIAQIYPAIVANRLKGAGDVPCSSPSGIGRLERLMTNLQHIPEHVDEVAGALYEEDLGKCTQYLGKVKRYAVNAVDSVKPTWDMVDAADSQQKDKFTIWSKTWMNVLDEVSKSVGPANQE